MKKCPNCGSAKYQTNIVEGKVRRKCYKCGYVNHGGAVRIKEKW